MYKGKERSIARISQLSGKTKQYIYSLIDKYTAKEIEQFLDGYKKPGKFEYKGKRYTLKELATVANVNYSTLSTRIYKGWDINDAVEIPAYKGEVPSNTWRKENGIH